MAVDTVCDFARVGAHNRPIGQARDNGSAIVFTVFVFIEFFFLFCLLIGF